MKGRGEQFDNEDVRHLQLVKIFKISILLQ